MYVVEDKGGAIGLMLAGLIFLGTWPAVLTLLERRGRLPQHIYLDYSLSNLAAALLIALTLSQIGDSKPNMPDFFTQLSQDNWSCVIFAMAGGIFLSLGNLATQYAWAYIGLSVTEVITASITVVIGTSMIYFLDDRINKAEILFPGVAAFLMAVFLGSAVHASNAADNRAKLSASTYCEDKTWMTENPGGLGLQRNNDVEKGNRITAKSKLQPSKAEVGTADFLLELEDRRAIKVLGSNAYIGLGIVIFAGISLALFSPAFNLATNDQWHTLKEGVGLLCGFGNGFQFMGSQAAGYAAEDAVQALPPVWRVQKVI